ncbi:hypothetical protein DCCM_0365 [Desulfocucumis palustris]|uniref:Uncharacterized protein n=1 Tax=Desulfocucumis palustris TaxID=1898651 RepID=A0A2L2X8C4_9FIRM|nr:hypothetical protein DCCM_0365 [Desulfocucumis palustris]
MAIVTTAQRQGELEWAPPALCLNNTVVTKQAAVPGNTPSNAARRSVKKIFKKFNVRISIT